MNPYGFGLKLKWDWQLYRLYGFKKLQKDYGYWTEWLTPVIPGVWLANYTEGPP